MENISITSELRKLGVKESVIFPQSMEWSTIRTIAGRFNSAGQSAYSVKKIEGGYEVTRTR
jgi:hypothetical protein